MQDSFTFNTEITACFQVKHIYLHLISFLISIHNKQTVSHVYLKRSVKVYI